MGEKERTGQLLSTKEAAHLLGVSPRTLEGWRLDGLGPAYTRLGARTVRYRVGALERFAAEGERRSPADSEAMGTKPNAGGEGVPAGK